jgi:hypothetical protein
MQLEKTKLAKQIGIAFLGANLAFSAAADTFTATVQTVNDVGITEKQALDFGTTILTTAGGCTMTAALPGAILMEFTNVTGTAVDAQDTDYGKLVGTSCVDTAGSDATVNPGVWRISGTPGAEVNILLSTVAQASADYTFVPTGCYVNFTGDDTTTGDTCLPLTPGSALLAKKLAAAFGTENDSVFSSGVAATAGDLLFTIGGELTVINPLVAETDYPVTFQIDVTY